MNRVRPHANAAALFHYICRQCDNFARFSVALPEELGELPHVLCFFSQTRANLFLLYPCDCCCCYRCCCCGHSQTSSSYSPCREKCQEANRHRVATLKQQPFDEQRDWWREAKRKHDRVSGSGASSETKKNQAQLEKKLTMTASLECALLLSALALSSEVELA